MKLQKGDVFRIDGHEYAVFYVSADILGMIRTDVAEFQNFDTNDFLKKVTDGAYEQLPMVADTSCPTIPEVEMKKISFLASTMDGLVEALYPNWSRITGSAVKHEDVNEAASLVGYTNRPFRRLFYRYLRSGCNMSSLIDNRHLKMANMQKTQQSSGLIEQEPQILTHRDDAFLYGLRVFKERLNARTAYKYMIKNYYSTICTVVENGVLEQVIKPNADAPSYHTLYRYIEERLGGLKIRQFVKGDREVRNNDRLLTGNQRSGLITIGQMMQLDECEIAVDLVDGCGRVVGKPVVYCAFDPAAQIVIGLYIGFINNAFGGVCNLFLSMMEPHENQTSLVGVHCDDYNFPSMVFPKQVYTDQGSEYMSGMMEKAMLELGITVSPVPAAAGSYKGGVENVFRRLQSRLEQQLCNDGYIRKTHEGPDEARANAVLTIDDFKAICYRLVIELNTTSLGDLFSPDLDMIENHIPPVPAEIWKHKMKTCFDPVMITDKNRMQKMFCLLWRDKAFSIGRDGLTYKGHNLRYFVAEDWFEVMLRQKNPKLDIRYNDTDLSRIYVRYKDVIHVVPLATARDELRSFVGMSWTAYDVAFEDFKKLRKEQRQKDLATSLTALDRNDQTLAVAKAAHAGIVNDVKSIPEARAMERARLETSPDETRNRLLGAEPLAIVEPEKKEECIPVESSPKYKEATQKELLALLEDEED